MIVLNQKQKRVLLILGVVAILLLAIMAIITAIRLQQIGTEPVAPSVPKSKPKAEEVIPTPAADSACVKTFQIALGPTLTPTPTCSIQPPTGMTHNAPACVNTGETKNVTISWNAVQQDIIDYRFRLDSNSPSWGGDCLNLNNGDICIDSPETFRTLALGPGTYDAWVHTNGECISEPVYLNFEIGTCGVVPTPTSTPGPTATNTPQPTNTPVPGTPGQPTNTPVPLAQGPTAIPTVAQQSLPEAGGVLPTVGAVVGGLGIILLGLLLLL